MPGKASDPELPASIVHATCVAYADRGVLIQGASGSGKSALALQMMGCGCELVADDRVAIAAHKDGLRAEAPPSLPSLIEARGVGMLHAVLCGPARLVAAVDMDVLETERLPKKRELSLMGRSLPLFYRVEGPHFAAALVQMLKLGWHDPE